MEKNKLQFDEKELQILEIGISFFLSTCHERCRIEE